MASPSKGIDVVEITEDKLSVDDICDQVSATSCGAISVFIGTTRDNFEGKDVLKLEYEAYMPMAKRKMLEVCASIRKKWDVYNIAIIHRISIVPVKEASIVIAISSAHRKESLEAVQYAIDTVKAVVPVWKKEIYADDSSSWKQNKECLWANDGGHPHLKVTDDTNSRSNEAKADSQMETIKDKPCLDIL